MNNLKCIILVVITVFSSLFSLNKSMAQQDTSQDSTIINVVYFHTTIRCQACLTIQKFADETMKIRFQKEIESGKIIWQVINYQKEKNVDYADHYNLENQALIISKKINGKETEWRILDKVWELLGDYDQFQEYVVNNIKEFL